MRNNTKRLLTAGMFAGLLLGGTATSAAADHDGSGSYGSSGRASSYINGDAGKNSDVDRASSCFQPDQYDKQMFSSSGSGNPGDRNVHNDACFLDDGRNDLCFQSAYQAKGIAGDFEFHARMNNTGMPGTQYVTWCSDRDADGCSDEWNKSSIRIDWSADGTASYSSYGSYSGWGS